MLELVFLPFVVLMAVPFLPLAPSLPFAICFLARRRTARRGPLIGTLAAAVAWLLYGIYETRMYFWAQTVIAPIRVDLLLIVPLMYGVTILGIWNCLRLRQRTERVE